MQILNSELFQQVTGKVPSTTPISAKIYADQGLPFYKIYGETSTVKGDFTEIKFVNRLNKIKNENAKRENEEQYNLESNKKSKVFSIEDDEGDSDEDEWDSDDDQDEDNSLNDDDKDSDEY